MENAFGVGPAYTVGIEEEFQLVDPSSRALVPAVERVISSGGGTGLVTSELSRSCVEMVSPVFGNVADLARELPLLRREVSGLARNGGAEIVAAGTHPFSDPTEQPLADGDHNARIEEEMGWVARTQAIYGLHIHVAVSDGEAAIGAVNELARWVPLLVALSANSPFWRGSDTRLASTRIKIFEMFPRSGLPPAFRDWEDFVEHVETLIACGSIPDYSWCWWDARPHLKFGTVELRAPDVQTDASHTASLVALVQCLVASADGREPEDPLFIAENKWRAVRRGLDATFYDFPAGESVPARAMARTLVEELRPVSQGLGCEAELEGILEIADHGNGAERQREAFGRNGSLEDLVDHVARATTPG
ncbi:YbdK family carboxylate-amine ligase [Rubrobacter tropicus]|uniref:Putative glutamate--cysteine ligase 2 n=1 Tax=Rubrobacter tropicus TaxID=2653851 RepID=A0A6G8QE52_9ACTN|nr:YbdK family carboxylate-amine ligase [Rubrobacter tropicus]QIN84784.1 YbdK family carboxylate-amine ligase [Rubrobacter tropicus]